MANFNNPLSFLLRKNCCIILLNVYNNWGKQWNTTRCQQLTSIIKTHHCQYQKCRWQASFLSVIEFLVHVGYLGSGSGHVCIIYRPTGPKLELTVHSKGAKSIADNLSWIHSSCHIWSIYYAICWAVLSLNWKKFVIGYSTISIVGRYDVYVYVVTYIANKL